METIRRFRESWPTIRFDQVAIGLSLGFVATSLWLSIGALESWLFWTVAGLFALLFFLTGSLAVWPKLTNIRGRIRVPQAITLAYLAVVASIILVLVDQMPLAFWWASLLGANLGSLVPYAFRKMISRMATQRVRGSISRF